MKDRDIIDKSLRSKLEGYESELPVGMWNKIEQGLGGGVVSDRVVSDAEFVAANRRHKSFGRGAVWYSAAAAILVGVMFFSLYKSAEPVTVAEVVEAVRAVQGNTLSSQPASAHSPSEPIAAAEMPAQKVVLALTRTVKPATLSKISSIDVINEDSQTTGNLQTTDNDTGDKAPLRTAPQRRSEVASSGGQKTKTITQQIEDSYAAMRQKRRRGSMSAAVYASGASFGNTNVNTQKTSMSAMRSFNIREDGVIPTNGLLGSSFLSKEYAPDKLKHDLPLSFGVSFSWNIAPRLDIETGLTYTYLRSKGETNTGLFSYKRKQELHYLGIPVSVKYNFVQSPRWSIYLRGGAMVERGVFGSLHTTITEKEPSSKGVERSDIPFRGVQLSLSAGAGAEYRFVKNLGLYLEPGVQYYFRNDDQPSSYRTENPLHFSMKAGLRVNF